MKINWGLTKEEIQDYHIGEKYGRLTIIDKAPFQIGPNGKKRRMVKCECDCKNHTIIICSLSNLRQGHTKSCGCLKSEIISKNKSLNLKGKRFGRLLVLKRIGTYESKGHKQSLWECKCDCGNTINLPAGSLVKGLTKSCGCLSQEHLKKFGDFFKTKKKKDITGNKYGKLTALYLNEKLTKEKNDKQSYWHCKCDCGNEVDVRLGNLQSGDCQSCGCIKSKGEMKIQIILKELNISFKKEKRFSKCKLKSMLPFDFYLPDYNLCIEFQGEQHFSPVAFKGSRKDPERIKKAKRNFGQQIKRDNIKRKFCKNNNIKLLEIPYWEKENIEEILYNALYKNIFFDYT